MTTLDHAEIVAWGNARFAQQLRDHQARKEARRALRAEMSERRRHGLASRHARKLARLGEQRLSERIDSSRQDAEISKPVTVPTANQLAREAPSTTTPRRDSQAAQPFQPATAATAQPVSEAPSPRDSEDGAHHRDPQAHPGRGLDGDRRRGQPDEHRRPRQRPSAMSRRSRATSRRPPLRRATCPGHRRAPLARPPPGAG